VTKSIVKNLAYRVNHGDLDVKKLSKIIDNAYAAMNEPQFKQKTSFAPSTIGFGHGKCPRYWYIAFDGAMFVESRLGQDYANMQTGTDAHERLGKLLENSELDVKFLELELTHDDPPIRGFIDVGVDRQGQEVIGEIKTTRSEAFNARQAKMQPPDYHLLQILWMRTVKKLHTERQLPEIPYRSNSKVCKRCPVRDTCFSESYGEGDVKLEPLNIM